MKWMTQGACMGAAALAFVGATAYHSATHPRRPQAGAVTKLYPAPPEDAVVRARITAKEAIAAGTRRGPPVAIAGRRRLPEPRSPGPARPDARRLSAGRLGRRSLLPLRDRVRQVRRAKRPGRNHYLRPGSGIVRPAPGGDAPPPRFSRRSGPGVSQFGGRASAGRQFFRAASRGGRNGSRGNDFLGDSRWPVTLPRHSVKKNWICAAASRPSFRLMR